MSPKQKDITLLITLIVLIIAINYNYLDTKLTNFLSNSETAKVQRVIDGDTIEIENKTSVRLLGINTPEKGEIYYNEAKRFLEDLVLNKTIILEFSKNKYDMYDRTLAYIFKDNENINLKIIEEGFGNFYFPSGRDKYYNQFKEAWNKCVENKKNFCEPSEDICAKCIELKDFNYKGQTITFYNKCNFDCDLNKWEIKDEGRKKFVFPDFDLKSNMEIKIIVSNKTSTDENLYWENEDYVWTKTGDTLLLRDNSGKLILWKNY